MPPSGPLSDSCSVCQIPSHHSEWPWRPSLIKSVHQKHQAVLIMHLLHLCSGKQWRELPGFIYFWMKLNGPRYIVDPQLLVEELINESIINASLRTGGWNISTSVWQVSICMWERAEDNSHEPFSTNQYHPLFPQVASQVLSEIPLRRTDE